MDLFEFLFMETEKQRWFLVAGEKPLAWFLLSEPVSDAVQVAATLNLGDDLFFSIFFRKMLWILFHLSESAFKSKLEDAKENKRQRRTWEKVKILFLSLYATSFSFISLPSFFPFFCM